jgi:hypothetical protein
LSAARIGAALAPRGEKSVMETVFQASLALDAHIVRDLLERAGIPSHIEGEYLQGAAGELPLGNLVRVLVAPEHAADAREVIAEWEKAHPADPKPRAERKRSWAPYTFVLGGLLGFFAAWIQYNTPMSEQGIDYDNDGVLDERYFYAGQKTVAIELDRNSDGNADARYEYDSHGLLKESLADNDFDRRFETHDWMVRGQTHLSESDLDGDGFAETVYRYRHGITTEGDFISPKSRAVLKRSYFRAGWLVAADFDADGDGKFERHVEYDDMGDPKP